MIDINTVADGFGDFDGKTSESELEFISKYFANHQQAWAIGSIPAKYKNGKAKLIPAETVKNTLGYSALVGPYTSEKNLRQELAGFSIRTPFVGIYVLDRNRQCCLIRFFRAPGPQIGTADWDELVLL
ncbi:hypothetical protein JW935_21970 [candidate division KSB1 bacterium]|nr:hypothetical protein [candidate division KSB1 bacterium]